MALLFVSRQEGRIVRFGYDHDPTYRPISGSDLDRAADSDYEDELYGGPRGAVQAILNDRARRAGGLDINVNSKHWRSRTRVRGFVLAPGESGYEIVGVGNFATKFRAGWRGHAIVHVSDWRPFPQPVGLPHLLHALPNRFQHVVERIFTDEESRLLPLLTYQAWVDAVRVRVPTLDELFGSLPPFPLVTRIPLDRLAERDAGQTALRLFASQWRNLEPVPDPPAPSPLALRLESAALLDDFEPTAHPDEDEVITADTGAFLDWDPAGYAFNGWFRFVSEGRQLLVKNVNYKPEETATGADLVFVRSNPAAVVLVQYKLLEAYEKSDEYFFRDREERLKKQVQQMLKFATTHASDDHGDDDYRLAHDIGFVKFVEPTQPTRTGELLGFPNGRYHPVEGVLRMLNKPSKGKLGGDIHHVDKWRSLDGETFAKLVRDQWVGSTAEVTRELFSILEISPNRATYLAVEEDALVAERT